MQVKLIPSVSLFLGSYFPLSAILFLQDISEKSWAKSVCWSFKKCEFPILSNPGRSLTFFAICLVSLLFFILVLNRIPGLHELTVKESKTVPNDLINYVFPYVVSFMGLDLGGSGKFYGFIVFLAWMFLITYRSGQILMNPLLLAMGWQLYEISADIHGNGRNIIALSKSKIYPGDKLKSCVVQGIYVLSKFKE
ncbi:hypothetical protein [Paraburkholderia sediminicola]|uniref:hypothetical protein n=1 Tax=Paraburkholderia sediminicola TaxID=458836 RepID=UPI0038B7C1FE